MSTEKASIDKQLKEWKEFQEQENSNFFPFAYMELCYEEGGDFIPQERKVKIKSCVRELDSEAYPGVHSARFINENGIVLEWDVNNGIRWQFRRETSPYGEPECAEKEKTVTFREAIEAAKEGKLIQRRRNYGQWLVSITNRYTCR